jgi:hypothetical protein
MQLENNDIKSIRERFTQQAVQPLTYQYEKNDLRLIFILFLQKFKYSHQSTSDA